MRNSPIAVLVLCFACALRAQDTDSPSPDPRALLDAAREASLQIQFATYHARYEEFGERHGAGVTECDVWLASADPSRNIGPRFRVRGERNFRQATGPVPIHAGFDGTTSRYLSASKRQLTQRHFTNLEPGQQAWAIASGDLGAGGSSAVLWNLVSSDPFKRDRKNETPEYEGRVTINSVLCDVIYLPGEKPHEGDRLFLGVDDHIPRKRERIGVFYTDRIYGSILTISHLATSTQQPPDDRDFDIPLPRGYQLKQYEPPVRDGNLIPVGNPAPEFTLTNDNGDPVSLSDYKGQVVVIDFWGTWCGPCVRNLPELQNLADMFVNQPVAVLTLSCHEPPNAKPRQLMTRNSCDLPILLNAEAVSETYGIAAFPSIYIIGAQGNVIFRATGSVPTQEFATVIRQHLANR